MFDFLIFYQQLGYLYIDLLHRILFPLISRVSLRLASTSLARVTLYDLFISFFVSFCCQPYFCPSTFPYFLFSFCLNVDSQNLRGTALYDSAVAHLVYVFTSKRYQLTTHLFRRQFIMYWKTSPTFGSWVHLRSRQELSKNYSSQSSRQFWPRYPFLIRAHRSYLRTKRMSCSLSSTAPPGATTVALNETSPLKGSWNCAFSVILLDIIHTNYVNFFIRFYIYIHFCSYWLRGDTQFIFEGSNEKFPAPACKRTRFSLSSTWFQLNCNE